MTIKTILCHLADDGRQHLRLQTAFDLAERFRAHLEAVYITAPVHMPAAIAGRGASIEHIRKATELARENAAEMEADFHHACTERGLTGHWTCTDGDHVDILTHAAIYADLAIVSQTAPIHLEEKHIALHMVDQLTMVAGCPVLVLPNQWAYQPVGRRVLVVWKASQEGTRAVRDALPVIDGAQVTTAVLTEPGHATEETQQALAAFLGRHGLEIESQHHLDSLYNADRTVNGLAEDLNVDLVVLGVYGQSRLRELFVGDATHQILEGMVRPILISH